MKGEYGSGSIALIECEVVSPFVLGQLSCCTISRKRFVTASLLVVMVTSAQAFVRLIFWLRRCACTKKESEVRRSRNTLYQSRDFHCHMHHDSYVASRDAPTDACACNPLAIDHFTTACCSSSLSVP